MWLAGLEIGVLCYWKGSSWKAGARKANRIHFKCQLDRLVEFSTVELCWKRDWDSMWDKEKKIIQSIISVCQELSWLNEIRSNAPYLSSTHTHTNVHMHELLQNETFNRETIISCLETHILLFLFWVNGDNLMSTLSFFKLESGLLH